MLSSHTDAKRVSLPFPTSRPPALLAAFVSLGLLASGPGGPGPLTAQGAAGSSASTEDPSLRIHGGLGAFELAGGDFFDIGAGPGIQIGVLGRMSSRFSLGAGVHHSWHSADRLSASFRVLSLHVEPRYRLPPVQPLRSARPFLGLRGGFARWEAKEESGDVAADVTSGGLQAAGVAGLAVPVSEDLFLEVALEAGYLVFGNADIDAVIEGRDPVEGRTVSDSDTDGFLVGVRSSLQLAFP